MDSGNAVPEPVSQSSAEAEYCGVALAYRAAAFVRMLALELRGFHTDMPMTVPVYIDNKAAQSMGHSFHDTHPIRNTLPGDGIMCAHKSLWDLWSWFGFQPTPWSLIH